MNNLSTTIIATVKNTLVTKPSNAFLLFLTGFFFTLFMLANILYTNHPLGGWITSVGTFTTTSILLASLTALSVCLIALWRSVATKESTKESKVVKASIVKTRIGYSPIDYPRGSTTAVVSGYALV